MSDPTLVKEGAGHGVAVGAQGPVRSVEGIDSLEFCDEAPILTACVPRIHHGPGCGVEEWENALFGSPGHFGNGTMRNESTRLGNALTTEDSVVNALTPNSYTNDVAPLGAGRKATSKRT
jgi:hypothetical protein